MKLLLYCTKAKPYIMKYKDGKYKEIASFYNKQDLATYDLLNGKIVAECDYEVEEITYELYGDLDWQYDYLPTTNTMGICNLESASCLDRKEIENYLQDKDGYAIHIKNLHIFDEPRELSECDKIYQTNRGAESDGEITKAPQNMMYAQNEKQNKEYILISIKPEWLCKILNGEKTIEVRKRVLKEMLR